MRNKDGYIKKLMEIAIDISELSLFVHGCSTRLLKTSKRKKPNENLSFFLFHSKTVIYTRKLSNFIFSAKT